MTEDGHPRRGALLIVAVCLAALPLSGSSRAQTEVGPEPPEAPSRPLPATLDEVPDARLEATLGRRLEQIEAIEDLEVRVEAGWVYLEGRTNDPGALDRATSIVVRTEGVVDVVNEIELSAAVGERVAPVLEDFRRQLRGWADQLPLFGIALAVLLLFAAAARWVAGRERLFTRLGGNRFVADFVRQLTAAGLFLVGLLMTLELLDATALVGAVLGTAGLIGIAVGFAFKDLAENYITSLLLSLRQPFAPNDHVVIDGEEGKVVRLTSRATILMTLEGNHLRLPNSRVFKATILNYSRNPLRRFSIAVGVGVAEDLVEAQRIGTGVLAATDGVLAEPEPWAEVAELGDSNVSLRFHGWVDQRDANFVRVRSRAVRRVKDALDEAQIEMPEPIYRIHLRRGDEVADEQPPPERKRAPAPPDETPAPEPVDTADAVDRQIEAERAAQDESDLLDASAPQE